MEQDRSDETEDKCTYKFKKFIQKYVPITRHLTKEYFTSINCILDMIAGLSVGITMIPLSTAYAGIAEVPPETGLQTTLVGYTIYAIFGTVKEIFIGPSTYLSLVVHDFTHGLNTDFVVLLTFCTGLVQMFMTVTGLGCIVNFISLPVAVGFLNGAKINIVLALTPGLIGLQTHGVGSVDKVLKIISFISYARYWSDVPLGFTCIVVLFMLFKVKDIKINDEGKTKTKRALKLISISRNAIVILSATVASALIQKFYKQEFIVVGNLEKGVKMPSLPPTHTTIGNTNFNFFDMIYTLREGIVMVPLISGLATITIAKSYRRGKALNYGQEFFALSLANLCGGMLGAMPATGAIIASAVASTCNVKTPIAGLYTEIGFFIMVLTMLVTIFRSISEGLIGGMVFSMIHLICIWAWPHISVDVRKTAKRDKKYLEIKPDRGMFFPAANTLRDIVIKHHLDESCKVVMNCTNFTDIDFTSLAAIQSLSDELKLNGQELLLVTANPNIMEKIRFATKVSVYQNMEEVDDYISQQTGNE